MYFDFNSETSAPTSSIRPDSRNKIGMVRLADTVGC